MNRKDPQFPSDRTAAQRRKNLTDKDVDELELAGGVEGGMQAGSSGGPSESDAEESAAGKSRDQQSRR